MEEEPDRDQPADPRAERAAARARIEQQQTWVDLQVRQAMERGDFDNLAGAGKPIPDLGTSHDPDWWVKRLVERERITVLPPALQLRKDDAELDAHLDTLGSEREARAFVEDFNARVIRARYTPVDGPPLITMPRDVEATIEAWRERQTARRAERAALDAVTDAAAPRRRGWLRGARRRRR
ncbi:hypothetical protein CFH99_21480 [Nocardioides aromaticivorans]|uniref:DnaJ homologue subfamily C member 28 conserved domain-containing protein n=1 Tax=Nocardioides aromaticivorans TaxID=200618 RepID=A0ABX7PQZ1_9ACTN|nr:DUF1992 domain-containing protein [Nocardioides aromaticivorans]QSR28198.1 hypothetical protein CFH99_21480 [Nocardioides aromaticivorans]